MSKIKVIEIVGKTSDMCHVTFKTADGVKVGERDGYVPDFMPGQHFGDYIQLDIDIETGQILNWVKPTQKELKGSIDVED
jgi:hypothetical protein